MVDVDFESSQFDGTELFEVDLGSGASLARLREELAVHLFRLQCHRQRGGAVLLAGSHFRPFQFGQNGILKRQFGDGFALAVDIVDSAVN